MNRCRSCGRSFVDRGMRKQEKLLRTQSPFEHYILEGYSVRQLSDQLQIKQHRIRRDIRHRLDISQITCIDEVFPNVQHIMIDGYWLPTMKDEHGYSIKRILLLYYEPLHEKALWFSIRD